MRERERGERMTMTMAMTGMKRIAITAANEAEGQMAGACKWIKWVELEDSYLLPPSELSRLLLFSLILSSI